MSQEKKQAGKKARTRNGGKREKGEANGDSKIGKRMPRTSREAKWVNRKKLRRHVDTGNSEMADVERFSRRWKYKNHGKRKTEKLN